MNDVFDIPPVAHEPGPPKPPAPVGMPSPHGKALAALFFMLVALGVVILLFAGDDEADELDLLDELAASAPAATNRVLRAPSVRTEPERDAVASLLAGLSTERAATSPTLSPRIVAEAMGHARSAEQYIRDRDLDAAERAIGKALDVWPDMNMAVQLLGTVMTQRGQFDQAIRLFEQALQREPFSAEVLNNLAINYMHKGEMGKAEELLVTSLQIKPDYPLAYFNLGFLHLRFAQHALAAENFERGLSLMPDNPGVINNLAVCLIRLGDYPAARQRLHELIARHPDRPVGYFNMAIIYVLEEDNAGAFEWIEKGAAFCTPSQVQTFLSDPDFDPIRPLPAFQQILQSRFPDIPVRPPRP